jgi:uncharacterized protein YdeI (YjbR/CyaY-like superfamily)
MITDIEDYFTKGCGRCERFATPDCSTRTWADGLAALRGVCLAAGLVESVKWGQPCYAHACRNIAIIGALRGDFRLGFMNAVLLSDPDQLLEKSGPNTQHPDVIRFRSSAEVKARGPSLRAYLKEAMDYAENGVRPARLVAELDLPDEFVAAMDADPGLAEAFHRLTPGRQRSHAIALNTAKTAATRVARIGKLRGLILAGKGAHER